MNRRILTVAVVCVLATLAGCNSAQQEPVQAKNNPAAVSTLPAGDESPRAENDPQRTTWRLDIAPYATLGSGHPGKEDADFDKPDGVAFTPSGLLLATDAKNRRVQVWDVKTRARLGEFGHKTFGGEVVDIAVAPSGLVLVTDQTLNLAYAFVPPGPGAVDPDTGKPLQAFDYQFKGTRFGEQGFDKLGGVAIDAQNRIYAVDAHLNEVRRFRPDCSTDPTWHFEKTRPDGDTYLHGCEGIAIREEAGELFVASEKDAVVQVFDTQSGRYKRRLVGAGVAGPGEPAGKHVFFGSVEGLTLVGDYLLAVDESAGHVQIFDIAKPTAYNADLLAFSAGDRSGGYVGFFGHAPKYDFEDKANAALQKGVKDGSLRPGELNPPGYFCSPDSIASFYDRESGDTFVAVADQCNYRIEVFRWSDIARAAGPMAPTGGAQAPGTIARLSEQADPHQAASARKGQAPRAVRAAHRAAPQSQAVDAGGHKKHADKDARKKDKGKKHAR
jgi:DNA-binding beta-propeller fold protein YncE